MLALLYLFSEYLDYFYEDKKHVLTVPVGGNSKSGRFVKVQYKNCDGEVLAQGSPFTNVNLETATSARLTSNCGAANYITHIHNKATIFDISTLCQLTAILEFPSKLPPLLCQVKVILMKEFSSNGDNLIFPKFKIDQL